MKERIHGVVDLLGARKPSYAALRAESSPIEWIGCQGTLRSFTIKLRTRDSIPAYTLAGYKLRGILYGFAGIPIECSETELPVLKPGESASVPLQFKLADQATRAEFDVLRPTGFSALTSVWTP
jgi:beta-glucuronidase